VGSAGLKVPHREPAVVRELLPLSASVRGGYAVMVADVSHSRWGGSSAPPAVSTREGSCGVQAESECSAHETDVRAASRVCLVVPPSWDRPYMSRNAWVDIQDVAVPQGQALRRPSGTGPLRRRRDGLRTSVKLRERGGSRWSAGSG
jgi:hypothetical protein